MGKYTVTQSWPPCACSTDGTSSRVTKPMACTSANRASTTRCRSRFSPLPGRQQADHVAKSAVERLHERNAAQKIVPILEQDLARIGVDQAADDQQQHESRDQSQARANNAPDSRCPTQSARAAASPRPCAPATKSHRPSTPAAARSPSRSWSALRSCAWVNHRMIGLSAPQPHRTSAKFAGIRLFCANAAFF